MLHCANVFELLNTFYILILKSTLNLQSDNSVNSEQSTTLKYDNKYILSVIVYLQF